jgi:CheY-like chemotaxis protein
MAKEHDKLILVTDDEPDMVEIITGMLGRIGYRTLKAYSGRECIEVARRERPDLLFLDIRMTPMDGWSVAHAMKNDPELRDIPIVMITGKELTLEDIMDRAQLIENYIMKPASVNVLSESVEDVLAAKSRSERILSMAGKSGVKKEMLNELKDRYMRKFTHYRDLKRLYSLYSVLYADNNNDQKAVLLACLKKGLDQQEDDLARIEKLLMAPQAAKKAVRKKSAA